MVRRILHTSDWHLGRRLKERDRSQEFAEFLNWLEKLITSENIDTLLIAGDIFDNTTPHVPAQEMYYSFLSRLTQTPCRHTVIISGNHDSPSFLDAPSRLLKLCKIHVIGQACENPADEVIPLYDSDGSLELIVCAVPYLRDKDVRTLSPSDNPSETERAITDGIRRHYSEVFTKAQELQQDSDVPVIAMGHMFIQGGSTRPDDGVRSLYVGTALQVAADIFPEWITYTALGHLHSPQKAGRENIRYSGSPLAMGFGEAGQRKAVCIIDLDGRNLSCIREIDIPVFQRLERATGSMQEIERRIHELGQEHKSIWLDVAHTANDPAGDLQARVNDIAKNYDSLEILSIRDDSRADSVIGGQTFSGQSLDDIDPLKIFREVLKDKDISGEREQLYISMYHEILRQAQTGEQP